MYYEVNTFQGDSITDGGNRVVDAYARIAEDIITLKPDYMSLFIGRNDVYHETKRRYGVPTEKFINISDKNL